MIYRSSVLVCLLALASGPLYGAIYNEWMCESGSCGSGGDLIGGLAGLAFLIWLVGSWFASVCAGTNKLWPFLLVCGSIAYFAITSSYLIIQVIGWIFAGLAGFAIYYRDNLTSQASNPPPQVVVNPPRKEAPRKTPPRPRAGSMPSVSSDHGTNGPSRKTHSVTCASCKANFAAVLAPYDTVTNCPRCFFLNKVKK
jgi:hypothetical protein